MSNRVFIKTEKPAYVQGETVNGFICLSLVSEIDAKSIVLKCTGYQKVKWTEKRVRYVPDGQGGSRAETTIEVFDAKSDFFRAKVKVFETKTRIPAGNWSYPFSYKLPDSLPGVFNEHGGGSSYSGVENYEAKILYKVKAMVDVAGHFSPDLKAREHLVVNEKLDKALKPVEMTEKRNVMFCCCVNKGTCELKAYFDANAYAPGQQANIYVECDNDSTVDIDNIVVILYRTIEFRDGKGHFMRHQSKLQEYKFKGVKAKSKEKQNTPIQLNTSLTPSTQSSLIKCSYQLNVEADIPWCPDVEIHLPLQIYAPQPQAWGTAGYDSIQWQPYKE